MLLLEDLEHLAAQHGIDDLLRVTRIRDWFVLVVGQAQMAELVVRDVLNEDPGHAEQTVPLVRLALDKHAPTHRGLLYGTPRNTNKRGSHPEAEGRGVIHRGLHDREAAEAAGGVDAVEEEDRPGVSRAAEGLVQPPVALVGAGPDPVSDK